MKITAVHTAYTREGVEKFSVVKARFGKLGCVGGVAVTILVVTFETLFCLNQGFLWDYFVPFECLCGSMSHSPCNCEYHYVDKYVTFETSLKTL